MTFENAQFVNNPFGDEAVIRVTIDGTEVYVPQDSANTHYAEIISQVEAGTLTIAAAE